MNLISGEILCHEKFISKTCASAFNTSKQPVVRRPPCGEISTTKNQWLAVVTHTWVPGSISNKKPQINKSLTTKDINFPYTRSCSAATHRFREISALLFPHLCPSLEGHQVTPRSDVKRGRRGGSLRHCRWGEAAAGLAADRDCKPPKGSKLWQQSGSDILSTGPFLPQYSSRQCSSLGNLQTTRASSCSNTCFAQQG